MSVKKLGITLPASFVSDTPHLREKTSKVGLVGRAAAIFTVNEIIVYRDSKESPQTADLNMITSLLSYMEMPQYLRKRVFKLEPQLQYAGILPPLRTPHHPLTKSASDLKVGDHREGFVLSKTREGALVDIGFEEPALLSRRQFTLGRRLTVRVTRVGKPVEVAIADPKDIKEYWGYSVSTADSLKQVVEDRRWNLRIATSKKGVSLVQVAKELGEQYRKADGILMVFGAPTRGLIEIAQEERFNLEQAVDCFVNTIPNQGTETVRTEEAILASLAILRIQFGF